MTQTRTLDVDLRDIVDLYGDVIVIVSPPRSASTALSRILWNHPAVAFYCHEPFEPVFFNGVPAAAVVERLEQPLELRTVIAGKPEVAPGEATLLVKEISFQVGGAFDKLAALTRKPLVFIIRDPRLTIESRMKVIEHYRGRPTFDPQEFGWVELAEQVAACRAAGTPYVLVEATRFRERPAEISRSVFARLGLAFDEDLLRWSPVPEVDLAGLRGPGDRYFQRVLASTGVEPPTEAIPPLDAFPAEGGFRARVEEALAIYAELLQDPELL
jgi:hypothetical protein